jgi:hypothetical protein
MLTFACSTYNLMHPHNPSVTPARIITEGARRQQRICNSLLRRPFHRGASSMQSPD